MTDFPAVQILMATYNGEKFLAEQLDSILAQTYPNWKLLVRDDGSKDSTPEILTAFKTAHPDKIEIVKDNGHNLGFSHNFERLAQLSSAPVLSFADQDDVWHPDKITRSVETLEDMGKKFGNDTPLLVHHDFTHMDAGGRILCKSFDAAHGYRKSHPAAIRMPFAADMHGFSMTFNRKLLDIALPFPEVMSGHDSVIGCLASDIGRIQFIPEQLADYRKHGNNSSQSVSFARRTLNSLFVEGSIADLPENLCKVFDSAKENVKHKQKCAVSFIDTYNPLLSAPQRQALEDFIRLDELSVINKTATLFRQSGMSWKSKVAAALIL